jgi:hypothetical protein
MTAFQAASGARARAGQGEHHAARDLGRDGVGRLLRRGGLAAGKAGHGHDLRRCGGPAIVAQTGK